MRNRVTALVALGLVAVVIAVFVMNRGPCPSGADLTGLAPPQGTEQWCQRRTEDDRFLKHGPYTQWHANGAKAAEGRYLDGSPDGQWVEWHPNGQRKVEGTYSDGQKHGRWLRWLADGQRAGEVVFDHGKAPGEAPPSAVPEADAGRPASGDDPDQDWIGTARDNCPQDPNPGQENLDGDGLGDACDDDTDGDKFANPHDNCPRVANQTQVDVDRDGRGDACDDDLDEDGVLDANDNCPSHSNRDQADADGDGTGDECEPPDFLVDMDADGIPNEPADFVGTPRYCGPADLEDCFDNCVSIPNPDQLATVCEPTADADGDGVPNGSDNCIVVPNPKQERTRGQAPFGFGDACDGDQDGDGVRDLVDNCSFAKNPDQKRSRAKGPGDACVLPVPVTK